MAGRVAQLLVKILGDSSSAERSLKRTEQAAAPLGNAFTEAGKKGKSAFQGIAAAANNAGMGLNPVAGAAVGVSTALGGLDESATRGQKAMVAGGVAAAGLGLLLTKMGDESKKAEAQLRTAFENAGSSMDEFDSQVAQVSNRLIKLGFDDEATARSLATLATATQDPAKAIESMGTVADIAAARHISLESAADKLAKAYSGNSKVFKEFGIQIAANATPQEKAAALTELQARVSGQAAAQAENFSTKLESTRIRAENLAEALGTKLGPAISLAGVAMTGLGGLSLATGMSVGQMAAKMKAAAGTSAALSVGLATLGRVAAAGGLFTAAVGIARVADENVSALERIDKAVIGFQRRIPIVGDFLADLDEKTLGFSDSSDDAATATNRHAAAMGISAGAAGESKKALEDAALAATKQASSAKSAIDTLDGHAKALRTQERAAESLEDAERSVADAQARATESVVNANRRIEDSHRSLDAAHRRELDAQESLAEARKGAAEDLEDLRQAQEANALAEERAALNVDKANQDIGKSKTLSEEKEARLGLREAELSLADAQEKRREDAEALNQAEAAGVEGSRRVMDAKRGVEDAIRAVGDAERAVTDAMAAAAQAQVDGARAVEQAQRAVRDAVASVAEAVDKVNESAKGAQAFHDMFGPDAAARVKEMAKDVGDIRANFPPGDPNTASAVPLGPPIPEGFYPRPDKRAGGGPVAAGTMYEVNENRTEYFRPSVDGNVIPLRPGGAAATARPAAAEMPPITINFHVTGELDAWHRLHMKAAGREVVHEMMEEISRSIGSS